jgi:hypothetical protein
MKYPDWIESSKNGNVINNASQLNKHKDIFGETKEGICYAPCVIDAMSNCPKLKVGAVGQYNSNIDIKVRYNDTNYIDYGIHNINTKSCDMMFLIKRNIKTISLNHVTINYNYKTLSVVNVIKHLMDSVNKHVNGLGGADLEEKVRVLIMKD